ncbi:hypothetical protein BDZ90DRAFT_262728 [Jaminaea rosea]|uniref:Uncharacterized protein n=1 Tax=Jaminaea rosea TaxID=1569628 RepID=A0A316UHU7_9BASI|nr:hypothetical protein BDZ90DRAFT_262728 [Jaminaea rosea]PWN24866.1 hypothetical protein BDZ90DRAFT_262728 [Jaminaea rosea]
MLPASLFALICALLFAVKTRAMPAELAIRAHIPRHPDPCFKSNVYCLTVQTGEHGDREWAVPEGKPSWIQQEPGLPWKTYAFNGKFKGTLRMSCRSDFYSYFDVWFGWTKGWSNMTTVDPDISALSSDGKVLKDGTHGGSIGSGRAWVDFAVWCI